MLNDKIQPRLLAVGLPHVPAAHREAHGQWQKKFTANTSVLYCGGMEGKHGVCDYPGFLHPAVRRSSLALAPGMRWLKMELSPQQKLIWSNLLVFGIGGMKCCSMSRSATHLLHNRGPGNVLVFSALLQRWPALVSPAESCSLLTNRACSPLLGQFAGFICKMFYFNAELYTREGLLYLATRPEIRLLPGSCNSWS